MNSNEHKKKIKEVIVDLRKMGFSFQEIGQFYIRSVEEVKHKE